MYVFFRAYETLRVALTHAKRSLYDPKTVMLNFTDHNFQQETNTVLGEWPSSRTAKVLCHIDGVDLRRWHTEINADWLTAL